VNVARLLLRVTIGGFFVGHGLQKLTGSFGGSGLEGTGQFFESIGLRPGRRHALAAGTAETTGGVLVATGLAMPLAAATITSVMLTAVHRVHAKNGPWSANGGYEYNATIVAALLALTEMGPGDLSLDHVLGIERRGTGWALAALGGGLAGAALAHLAASAAAEPSAEPPADLDEAEAADEPIAREADLPG
jgi:putative oxidoreductase